MYKFGWLWPRMIERIDTGAEKFFLDFAEASSIHRMAIVLPMIALLYYCLGVSKGKGCR
jgi:hypothetical protein